VRFRSEPLAPHHTRDEFNSGQSDLDDWLMRFADHADAMNTGRTFVWHTGDNKVVAYFTLAAHLVRREHISKRVGRGSPIEIPAVLLARLALDQALQGQGLGGELLWDALSRAVSAGTIAAARLIVVHAIDDDAAAFYEHHGFVASPSNSQHLVQKASDIAAALNS
jgi:GNAT superfamily N-acetyltransferase